MSRRSLVLAIPITIACVLALALRPTPVHATDIAGVTQVVRVFENVIQVTFTAGSNTVTMEFPVLAGMVQNGALTSNGRETLRILVQGSMDDLARSGLGNGRLALGVQRAAQVANSGGTVARLSNRATLVAGAGRALANPLVVFEGAAWMGVLLPWLLIPNTAQALQITDTESAAAMMMIAFPLGTTHAGFQEAGPGACERCYRAVWGEASGGLWRTIQQLCAMQGANCAPYLTAVSNAVRQCAGKTGGVGINNAPTFTTTNQADQLACSSYCAASTTCQ